MVSPTARPAYDLDVEVFRLHGTVPELLDELTAVCARVEDARVRPVLHLAGDPAPGTAESATAGSAWPEEELTIRTVTRWERVLRRLERVPAATVAVATGEVGPAALEILLCTDWRVSGADTVFALAERPWPGAGLFRMARQLGHAATRRLTVFPAALPASRAQEIGLVDEVRGGDIAAVLASAASAAQAIAVDDLDAAVLRQLHDEAASAQYDDAIGAHLAACDRVLRRRATAAVRP